MMWLQKESYYSTNISGKYWNQQAHNDKRRFCYVVLMDSFCTHGTTNRLENAMNKQKFQTIHIIIIPTTTTEGLLSLFNCPVFCLYVHTYTEHWHLHLHSQSFVAICCGMKKPLDIHLKYTFKSQYLLFKRN